MPLPPDLRDFTYSSDSFRFPALFTVYFFGKGSDDPVYRFMDKKRAEGKPYLVYMTAGANKFLRIYYGRVKEYLASLEEN